MFRRRWQTFVASALALVAVVGLWTSERISRTTNGIAPVAEARAVDPRESFASDTMRADWGAKRSRSSGPIEVETLNLKFNSTAERDQVTAPLLEKRTATASAQVRPVSADLVRVHTGQCLWTIAKEHHTSVAAIVRLNHLRSTVLHIGQALRLPHGATHALALPKSPEASPSYRLPSLTYTVQPGDSLWEISNIFGVSVSAICSANHLSPSDVLYPGERLVIDPSSSFGGAQAQNVLLREAPHWLIPIYKEAGAKYDIPWTVLAAIHKVETDFSTDGDIESYAGAIGPMQFMPSTFAIFGVPAPGHKVADIHNVEDAIFSAAHMLHQEGFSADPYYAIWTYNHSATYVEDVLHLAIT
ncbi:lytic transglycosylase domain-containing protein [Alicyclobacillus vulcanalis]|uniref:LysM domain-containing protein n=1 Tax=Alicyclobacillus vulcanalis TaxID=252246 RepID=A0A1N7NDL7_9BACL|nr:lytic transglycosylase domain-containing protein [Alicyclobacillus vulcanalis]SIS96331.1 LysM domain-containing protein [Alicyclobacillus vulcanalis]